jgi:hypothetical protein
MVLLLGAPVANAQMQPDQSIMAWSISGMWGEFENRGSFTSGGALGFTYDRVMHGGRWALGINSYYGQGVLDELSYTSWPTNFTAKLLVGWPRYKAYVGGGIGLYSERLDVSGEVYRRFNDVTINFAIPMGFYAFISERIGATVQYQANFANTDAIKNNVLHYLGVGILFSLSL